jgi:hypothetical protein
VPEAAEDALGCLLSSVTAVETNSYEGYWPLAAKVVAGSSRLRDHILEVLGTAHIHLDTTWTNQYRLRAWRCLRAVQLPESELAGLQSLCDMERDEDIRAEALDVLRGYLPPDEQRRARLRLIERAYGVDTRRRESGRSDTSGEGEE